MNWLGLRTLHAWLVFIVLAALAISQAISFAVLTSQQTILRMSLHEAEAFRRTAGIVRLVRKASITELPNIATIASGPAFVVQFSRTPVVDTDMADEELSQSLTDELSEYHVKSVRVAWTPVRVQSNRVVTVHRKVHVPRVQPVPPVPPVPPAPPAAPAPLPPSMSSMHPTSEAPAESDSPTVEPADPPDPPEAEDPDKEEKDEGDKSDESETSEIEIPEPYIVQVSAKARRLDMAIELKSGIWLNVATSPPAAASFTWPLVLAGGSAALLVALAAIWAARRLARPLAGLAGAAERFGRGDDSAAAPEEGPTDIKRAAAAFNTMAQRLKKTLADQRTLLSAIGHDLRTPISSLRIRTEMVKDPELQQKMAATLDDMQRLTEAALAAARGGDTGEPSQALDLPSLVQALCDDMAEMGAPVSHGSLEAMRIQGRASEIKRALRNLIENAVRYGGSAEVSAHVAKPWAEIHVDDRGAGIPDEAMQRVFEPFVRLEESRSVDTGGNGLGLTIARAIALRHGGDLTLANRNGGGLRATLRLPLL